MRITESNVRSADRVIEIRVSARHGVIVSHINYTHLERVRRTRARLEYAHDDVTLLDDSKARFA